jgi:hypothetical protein
MSANQCTNISNTYTQTMSADGFPDGGTLRISGCCDQHYNPGTPSEWNKETYILATKKIYGLGSYQISIPHTLVLF